MFKNLSYFSMKRTGKQAVGFYLAYFVLLVLIAGIAGGITGVFMGSAQAVQQVAIKVGTGTVTIVCLFLGYKILDAKKRIGNYPDMVLVCLSGACALMGGALLGLLPLAYLTTKPKKSKK